MKNLRKNKSGNLHVINLEWNAADLVEPSGKLIGKVLWLINKLMDDIVYDKTSQILEILKKINFDGAMTMFSPYEMLIVKKLGLPNIKWMSYFPDPSWTVAGMFL